MPDLMVWNKMFFVKKWLKKIKYRRFHIIEAEHEIRDNVGMVSIIRMPNISLSLAQRLKKKRILPRKLPRNVRRQLKMGAVVEIRHNHIIMDAIDWRKRWR